MWQTHKINPDQFPPFLPKLRQAPLCHHLNSSQRHGDVSKMGTWRVFFFFRGCPLVQVCRLRSFMTLKWAGKPRATWSGRLMGANGGRETQGSSDEGEQRQIEEKKINIERDRCPHTAKIHKQVNIWIATWRCILPSQALSRHLLLERFICLLVCFCRVVCMWRSISEYSCLWL